MCGCCDEVALYLRALIEEAESGNIPPLWLRTAALAALAKCRSAKAATAVR